MATLEDWQRISRDDLREIYADLTMAAIAARYGITTGAVAHKLRTWDIKSPHAPGPKPSFQPDPSELKALYERMSLRDIAAHYGVGETVVYSRVKQAGYEPVSRADRLRERPKSEAHREACRKAHQGKSVGSDNPNWKGGITTAAKAARSTGDYKRWKMAVLEVAERRCQGCGVVQGSRCNCCGHIIRLHVHHLKSFAEHPELRTNPQNGEALCERCHHVKHHGKPGELLGSP